MDKLHVNNLTPKDQEKWLHQRGWREVERNNHTFWRDPDTSVQYIFAVALKRAIDACRLPGDFLLLPN